MQIRFLLSLFFFSAYVNAQQIDIISSCRLYDARVYTRLSYENDFFTATDQYYTQGISLELVNPKLVNWLPMRTMYIYNERTALYGIALEHDGFTPSSIRHNEILFNDRPFAAAFMLKNFAWSFRQEKRMSIATQLSIGILGPYAGGEWMQKSIHRWLKNIEPLGWQNQIDNDAIINYMFSVEKNFFGYRNYFLLNGKGTAHVGTYKDELQVGFVLMGGKLNAKIETAYLITPNNPVAAEKEKLYAHLYIYPAVHVVGYDATLQGGLINRNSPYTVTSNEISRIYFSGDAGIELHYGRFSASYSQSIATKQFKSGNTHRWGGVSIAYSFK